LPRPPGWHPQNAARRSKRALPLRHEQPDALADALSRHAIAHRNDHAGAVLVGHDAREWHAAPANTAARVGVGRIGAGGTDRNPHLARSWLLVRQLADFEHLGRL